MSRWLAPPSAWRTAVLLPGAMAGLLGAALFTGSAPAGPSPPDLAGLLRVGWPVLVADSHLRRLGWSPAPVRQPEALDRQLAGNSLASLSDCSGTGLGFCRYDYRRADVNLSVITLPEQPLDKPVGSERTGPVTPAQKRSEANPLEQNQMEPTPSGPTGGARVVRWLDADSGRTWGLCAGGALPHRLVPCPEP